MTGWFARVMGLAVYVAATPTVLSSENCTPRHFANLVSETNISFQLDDMEKARERGESALACGINLETNNQPRFIKLLNRLNHIYKNLNRLEEVTPRTEKAYSLSREHLGDTHEVTMQSRDLYYEAMIASRDYKTAILLASENIALSENQPEEELRLYHYLVQLYSLYGLTGHHDKEAETLVRLVDLARKLFGKDDEDTQKYILDLAKSYCRQGNRTAFDTWTKKQKLNYRCG